ncbi:MAG: hypothetical protein LUQ24_03385 [Methanobacterium sp.]|nr:hypothetical protein [Methanobacterium sp.]
MNISQDYFDKWIKYLADELPDVNNKKAFLFSTAGISGKSKALKDHTKIREKLEAKGFMIVDEFQCKGLTQIASLDYLAE